MSLQPDIPHDYGQLGTFLAAYVPRYKKRASSVPFELEILFALFTAIKEL